jgi:predicted phosphoribosyltransferase
VSFLDRHDAGVALGARLATLSLSDPVVLALPRGGVPVAEGVATALGAPLDVVVVRKLGVPFQHELAMGAVGEDGVLVLDEHMVRAAGIGPDELQTAEVRERAELDRRVRRYREGSARLPVTGRTAVVVDDGMATGSTAKAACLVVRAGGASRVVMATPVASSHAVALLRDVADEVVVLEVPGLFVAVGQWYRRFDQTDDDEVVAGLARARRARGSSA